jgi:hypothetical protein
VSLVRFLEIPQKRNILNSKIGIPLFILLKVCCWQTMDQAQKGIYSTKKDETKIERLVKAINKLVRHEKL